MIVQLLDEFLNAATDVGCDIIVKRLESIFGTSIIKYKSEGDFHFYEIENYSLLKIKRDPALLEEIQKIAEIYNYIFRIYDRNFYSTNKRFKELEFSNENAILLLFKEQIKYNISMLDSDSPFNNLYLHGGYAPPAIVRRTGLRIKDQRVVHDHSQYNGFSAASDTFTLNFYPKECRIYMTALNRWQEFNRETLNTFKLETLCLPEYGKYKYLIKLPPSYPIIVDPEGNDPEGNQYLDWCYTTHSIPPQNILYIGYFDYNTMNEPIIVVTREDVINFINKKQV